ncbi:MAG: hypothetical protein JJV98_13000 [Desulfosarcina sp.]|nr:hypothetical protein [Desulfobacterales bacterium]
MRFREKIIEKLKYSTFLRILFDVIAKFGLRVTPYYVVREGIWGNGLSNLEEELEGYKLCFLDEDDMGPLSRLRVGAFSEDQLTQRLRDGHFCLGLIKDGEVVAFNWANPHESSGNLCRFPLKADEGYLYDAYTVHAYRGKRLAPYLRYQSYRTLSQKGMTRLYSISDAFNTPSIKFKKRLNARFVKLGISIKLLNRREYNFTLRQSSEFRKRSISADQAI